MAVLIVNLSDHLHRSFKSHAQARGLSMSAIVRDLLETRIPGLRESENPRQPGSPIIEKEEAASSSSCSVQEKETDPVGLPLPKGGGGRSPPPSYRQQVQRSRGPRGPRMPGPPTVGAPAARTVEDWLILTVSDMIRVEASLSTETLDAWLETLDQMDPEALDSPSCQAAISRLQGVRLRRTPGVGQGPGDGELPKSKKEFR